MNVTLEDICTYLDGLDNNIFFKRATMILREYSPKFLQHKCPYPVNILCLLDGDWITYTVFQTGVYTYSNVSLSNAYLKYLPIFPRGDYKTEILVWDNVDPDFFQFTYYSSINSAIQKWWNNSS